MLSKNQSTTRVTHRQYVLRDFGAVSLTNTTIKPAPQLGTNIKASSTVFTSHYVSTSLEIRSVFLHIIQKHLINPFL